MTSKQANYSEAYHKTDWLNQKIKTAWYLCLAHLDPTNPFKLKVTRIIHSHSQVSNILLKVRNFNKMFETWE